MKARVLVVLAIAALPVLAKNNVPPPGFTALFNGKDLTGWKIGTQIEGMEITVKSSISREARFVLTFDGI